MNEEITYESEPELSAPSPVLTLPGYVFFVDRIELPTALEASELDDFAELSLEDLAPFPVEQLYWGYLYSESANAILIYAAYRERVKALGYKDLEAYLWVLPDFATLWGNRFAEATTLQLEGEEGFSEIVFEADDPLPQKVVSWSGATDAMQSPSNLRLTLESIKVSEKGLAHFHFQPVGDQDAEDLPEHCQRRSPEEDDLWRADVRDPAFKKNERNSRKLTAWITRATGYAAIFAVFLVILEGALFLGELWIDSRESKIAAQAPEVRRIEDKQSLMNKLDQVAQNELRPIAMLEALNGPRPEGIYFTNAEIEDRNRIMVDGIANTIKELNTYMSALTASGQFEQARDQETNFSGGKTTFRVTLDYIHNDTAVSSNEDE